RAWTDCDSKGNEHKWGSARAPSPHLSAVCDEAVALAAPRRFGERDHPLRALWRGGDGMRRGRGEVQELLRECRDELVEDRLHRHQGGGPPLLVHHGDMAVGVAIHLL